MGGNIASDAPFPFFFFFFKHVGTKLVQVWGIITGKQASTLGREHVDSCGQQLRCVRWSHPLVHEAVGRNHYPNKMMALYLLCKQKACIIVASKIVSTSLPKALNFTRFYDLVAPPFLGRHCRCPPRHAHSFSWKYIRCLYYKMMPATLWWYYPEFNSEIRK